jgi:hypothetical protein
MGAQQTPAFSFEAAPARLSFDIEIADEIDLAPGDDLDRHGPFQIACAAALSDRGELRHWYARDAAGTPQRALDAQLAREMLLFLREAQEAKTWVCAWNGLSFDLRWLGHAADDLPLAREIALDLIDPMFQFFVQRGFPVGLQAVASGMGIAEKKLMDGADAPRQWALGKHDEVLAYVAGDCSITEQVVAAILAAGRIVWRTKKGTLSSEAMPQLRRVRELLDAPLPDIAWMSDPLPRSKFTAWLTSE